MVFYLGITVLQYITVKMERSQWDRNNRVLLYLYKLAFLSFFLKTIKIDAWSWWNSGDAWVTTGNFFKTCCTCFLYFSSFKMPSRICMSKRPAPSYVRPVKSTIKPLLRILGRFLCKNFSYIHSQHWTIEEAEWAPRKINNCNVNKMVVS